MITARGTYRRGGITLEEAVALPEGAEVLIVIPETSGQRVASGSDTCFDGSRWTIHRTE